LGILNRQRRLIQGTSARIVELLRRRVMTIDEMAGEMGLTRTAIRAQLATLERDGSVEPRGLRPGTSKPARTYGVTAEAELLFSRAYVPILSQLLHVLSARLPKEELDAIMHEVGRGLMTGRSVPRGSLAQRVAAASDLLNELGGMTDVQEEGGHFLIRGLGCPIAAATAEHPEACNALASFISEFVGEPVSKCCDLYERRRCCFEVANPPEPALAVGR
jgi:predicted ArsR family transcriptional regulator